MKKQVGRKRVEVGLPEKDCTIRCPMCWLGDDCKLCDGHGFVEIMVVKPYAGYDMFIKAKFAKDK